MNKNAIKQKIQKGKGFIEYQVQNNILAQLIYRYFKDNVGIRGAALAYYLLFSVFPLVILLSTIISKMNMDLDSIFTTLSKFLPNSALNLVMSYLRYIQTDYNESIMNFSIIFSIYFPWRAIKGLMYDIRFAFRQDQLKKPPFFLFRELLCTLIIPISFLASLILIIMGRRVILDIISILPPDTVHLSSAMLWIWNYARFILAGLIMSLSLTMIYRFSLNNKGIHFANLFPGTMAAILVWIIAGILFSFYAENYGKYSVVYGTLGAVIVLLLWLYLSGVVFIMGAELNAVILSFRQRKKNKNELDQDPPETKKEETVIDLSSSSTPQNASTQD